MFSIASTTRGIRAVKSIFWSRPIILFVLPNLVFMVVGLLTEAKGLILILSAAQISIAVAVCAAYFKAAFDIVVSRKPVRAIETAETLILGIFIAWFSLVMSSFFTISWRLWGEPMSWLNTDFTSYRIFMTCVAGALHLAAPHVVGHLVPHRRWVNIGILIGLAIFAAIMMGYFMDTPAALRSIHQPLPLPLPA